MIELLRLYWPLLVVVPVGLFLGLWLGMQIIAKWRARKHRLNDRATIRRIADQAALDAQVERIRQGRMRGGR